MAIRVRIAILYGTPGWIRTSGFQLRRLTLYPLSYGRISRALGTIPFCPISASDSDFNPRHTSSMPAVKIFVLLELEQN
jgi:hypothetical protein